MTPQRRQRLVLSALLVAAVGGAVALALLALERNINLFFSPSQVQAGEAPAGRAFRIGGMVVDGSVARGGGLAVKFALTDTAATVPVEYTGILPDLFREGQGIVALGALDDGVFVASQVLAKHDETYMPPEVSAALKAAHQARYGDDGDAGRARLTERGRDNGGDGAISRPPRKTSRHPRSLLSGGGRARLTERGRDNGGDSPK